MALDNAFSHRHTLDCHIDAHEMLLSFKKRSDFDNCRLVHLFFLQLLSVVTLELKKYANLTELRCSGSGTQRLILLNHSTGKKPTYSNL